MRQRTPDDETKADRLETDGEVWLTYKKRGAKGKGSGRWFKAAVFDSETDPFDHHAPNERIEPFCWGLMTVDDYWCDFQDWQGWTKEAPGSIMQSFVDKLEQLDQPHIIWAHNGGKFDFTFLIPWLEDIHIINGRIAEARIGHHLLRDSFLLFPESLGRSGDKDKFDYRKMYKNRRNDHKPEILSYLKQDCRALLHSYILRFVSEFGVHITMPTAAWKEMMAVMKNGDPDFEIEKMSEGEDAATRKWYAGGRVECFEWGILETKTRFQVFDINGAYAGAMRNLEHPIGRSRTLGNSLDKPYDFATITADSDGALFLRQRDDMDTLGYLHPGQLRFPSHRNERFFATRHEIEAGLETGRLKIRKVHGTRFYPERTNFAPFIDHFNGLRAGAKAKMKELGKEHPDYNLWDIRNLFYKRVQNGTYGKTAQDPREWKDFQILPVGTDIPEGWSLASVAQDYIFVCCPSEISQHSFYNVACGASITGAVRATLFRGLCAASRPVYCDTDSIICEDYRGPVDDTVLGAMKLEGDGDLLAIAGKKMYALFDTSLWAARRADAHKASPYSYKGSRMDYALPWKNGFVPCVKFACKGVQISPEQIFTVANRGQVKAIFEAPTISYTGAQRYQTRVVNPTAHIEPRTRRVGL